MLTSCTISFSDPSIGVTISKQTVSINLTPLEVSHDTSEGRSYPLLYLDFRDRLMHHMCILLRFAREHCRVREVSPKYASSECADYQQIARTRHILSQLLSYLINRGVVLWYVGTVSVYATVRH